jgi:hypothetical protein
MKYNIKLATFRRRGRSVEARQARAGRRRYKQRYNFIVPMLSKGLTGSRTAAE